MDADGCEAAAGQATGAVHTGCAFLDPPLLAACWDRCWRMPHALHRVLGPAGPYRFMGVVLHPHPRHFQPEWPVSLLGVVGLRARPASRLLSCAGVVGRDAFGNGTSSWRPLVRAE